MTVLTIYYLYRRMYSKMRDIAADLKGRFWANSALSRAKCNTFGINMHYNLALTVPLGQDNTEFYLLIPAGTLCIQVANSSKRHSVLFLFIARKQIPPLPFLQVVAVTTSLYL